MLAPVLRRFREPGARSRYSFGVCIGISLLLHALLIFAPAPQQTEHAAASSPAPQQPLTVRLSRAAPPPIATTAPEPVRKAKPAARPQRLIAIAKPAPQAASMPVAPPVPTAPAVPEPAPELDMMAMLNAKRAQRRAAEEQAAADPAAGAPESSSTNVALANIQHSLQTGPGGRSGTGGVFQIVSKGTRTGQFVFRGWLAGSRNNWRQTIDVDAGLNGDVDRAIVRRMIELIRSHYSADFNWDSHRLGRVVVLSARPSDNDNLEAFLMREFFGA